MFSILREFYLGNISPSENLKTEHPSHMEKSKIANTLEEAFLLKLSEDDKRQYSEIMMNRGLSFSEEVNQAFVDGFVLGFLFSEEITERRDRYAEN